ncbi:MAG: hypothetical protein ACE5D8_07240 [Fidelibacterota bacterium]
MDVKKRQRYADFLELLIVLALVFLFITLSVPTAIWEEEAQVEEQAHFRMSTIYGVYNFCRELTGEYFDDGFLAMNLVNAARDSVVADSTFIGEQEITLFDRNFKVTIPEAFDVEFDTTFGFQKTRRDTIIDTSVTILKYALTPDGFRDESRIDTVYIQMKQLAAQKQDSLFIRVLEEKPLERVEVISYFDSYKPDSSMFFCPVTNKSFVIDIQEDNIRIASPITDVVKEPRYFIFSFQANNHGYIDGGATSWD